MFLKFILLTILFCIFINEISGFGFGGMGGMSGGGGCGCGGGCGGGCSSGGGCGKRKKRSVCFKRDIFLFKSF